MTQFTPDTLLADFYDGVLCERYGCNRKRTATPRQRFYARRSISRLAVLFERAATIGDLTAANLRRLEMWQAACHLKGQWAVSLFKMAARVAYDMGLGGIKPKPQGWAAHSVPIKRKARYAPEGSLWEFCVVRYFPEKPTIRSDKTKELLGHAVDNLGAYLGRAPMLTDLNRENIVGMMTMLQRRGTAATTINERRTKLKAAWEFAARRRLVDEFPELPLLEVKTKIRGG